MLESLEVIISKLELSSSLAMNVLPSFSGFGGPNVSGSNFCRGPQASTPFQLFSMMPDLSFEYVSLLPPRGNPSYGNRLFA